MCTGVIIDLKIMAQNIKGGNLMKKALSVFLAILMMFSVLSIGSFAAEDTTSDSQFTSPWHGPEGSGKPAGYDQVVIRFNLNGGTLKSAQYVWNLETGRPEYTEPKDIGTGSWVMVPQYAGDLVADGEHYATLPAMNAPSDTLQFDGWYCQYDRSLYGANGGYLIPAGAGGTVIEFTAQWSPKEVEVDTMTKVMGILFKVFGTIIGLLFYTGDTEAGIALMEKVFGGLF